MSIEQIILAALGVVGSIVAIFKVMTPRLVDAKLKTDERVADAKLKAAQYEQMRTDFSHDTVLELLKEALEYLEKALTESNTQAQANHVYYVEVLQEFTKFSAILDRHSDLIRILTQEISVLSDQRRGTQHLSRKDQD